MLQRIEIATSAVAGLGSPAPVDVDTSSTLVNMCLSAFFLNKIPIIQAHYHLVCELHARITYQALGCG